MSTAWILSGLCAAYLMNATDERKKDLASTWIKGRGELQLTLLLILAGPLSLILGIVVLADYLKNSSDNQHDT